MNELRHRFTEMLVELSCQKANGIFTLYRTVTGKGIADRTWMNGFLIVPVLFPVRVTGPVQCDKKELTMRKK